MFSIQSGILECCFKSLALFLKKRSALWVCYLLLKLAAVQTHSKIINTCVWQTFAKILQAKWTQWCDIYGDINDVDGMKPFLHPLQYYFENISLLPLAPNFSLYHTYSQPWCPVRWRNNCLWTSSIASLIPRWICQISPPNKHHCAH